MATIREVKNFVIKNFELGSKFKSEKEWAAYMRSVMTSMDDDHIIAALCEIIQAEIPPSVEERGLPKEEEEKPTEIVVKSMFGEAGKMNFTVPNHKALAQMDSWLQYREGLSGRWERTVRCLFVDDDGKGWEGVKKNNFSKFMQAWVAAKDFCESSGVPWEEIANA